MNVGHRVRTLRKTAKLTMKELADQVGVSSTTIHRIETGQQSPSVALLSLIAQNLGHPITSFLDDPSPEVYLVNHEDGVFVDSAGLLLRLIVPFGMVSKEVSISSGQLKKGDRIAFHRNKGYEFSYITRGKCIFHYDGTPYPMSPKDAVVFSGKKRHAVEALEDTEFLAVMFNIR